VAARADAPHDAQPPQHYWLESLRSAWRQRNVGATLHALLALVHLTPENDPTRPEGLPHFGSPLSSERTHNSHRDNQDNSDKASQREAIVALICQHPATLPEDRQQAQALPHAATPEELEEAVRYFWPDAPKPAAAAAITS